ncbi:MAG: helix-turn-helix transcriptional regulator [Clostridia bacterium]|nr:helix-turn-helix transcriptional regulator [Clostridia bacterium]
MNEKDFALRVAQLRDKKGVSARDMSLSMGQNPGYINNIESGKSLPSMTGFFYICEYLEITPVEFFESSTADPTRLNNIIEDLKLLSDTQLDIITALVKDMVKNK